MERYSFDQEYVARLRDGDLATQRHFTRYFGDLLSIKLRSRLRAAHLIEEARQETFLRVLLILRREGLEHPERLGAFVNSVCNNVVLEFYRAESRTLPVNDDTPEPVDERPDPETDFVSNQRRSLVWRILESLPAKDRELLREIFLEESDKDEVCRQFQVDREYLRVLVHRAKARFRSLLQDEDGLAARSHN